jgi:hypothetical protein
MALNSYIKYQLSLAKIIGDKEALFIDSLKYWREHPNVGKLYQGKKWIYNTAEEWANQLNICSRHVRRIVAKLVKLGILLVEKLNFNKFKRTNYYTIDDNKLQEVLTPQEGKKCPNALGSQSLIYNTENTNTSYKIIRGNKDLSKIQDTFINDNKDYSNTNDVSTDREDVSGKYLSKVEKRIDHFMDEKDKLEAYKMLEIITDKLDPPLKINSELTMNILSRRLQAHFGTGREALTAFKDYCTCYAHNELLMGKKALKDGTYFKTNIGTILSNKFINDYLEKRGFFRFTNLQYSPVERRAPGAEDQERREQNSWFYDDKPAREKVMAPPEYVSPPASPEMEAMFERLGKTLGMAVKPAVMAPTAPSPSYPRPTLPKAEGPSGGLKSLLRAQKDYRPPNRREEGEIS